MTAQTKQTEKDMVVYVPGEMNIVCCVAEDQNGIEVSSYGNIPIFNVLAETHGSIVCSFDDAIEMIKDVGSKEYNKPWAEIDEELYNEMLNVLPPQQWHRLHSFEAFRMCEYDWMDYTGHYVKIGNRYFFATRQTAPNYVNYINEIKTQFDLEGIN